MRNYYLNQIGYATGVVVSLAALFMPTDLHWHLNLMAGLAAIIFALALIFNKKGS